jgi:hybrid cluster-associated redox disulfide protein
MITKDMLISETLKQGNAAKIAEVLMGYGMHCLGCAFARGETVAQAAEVHGINPDEMVNKLNEAAQSGK